MTGGHLDTPDRAGHAHADANEEFPAMYLLLVAGLFLLGTILTLFWMKDVLRSPRLARIVYSGLVARLALAGAAFTILAALLIFGDIWGGR